MSAQHHEHDEHGNCIEPDPPGYIDGVPHWRLSAWDFIGIGFDTGSSLFGVVGGFLRAIAKEFYAMANYSRANYDARAELAAEDAARREMGEAYRQLVYRDELVHRTETPDESP